MKNKILILFISTVALFGININAAEEGQSSQIINNIMAIGKQAVAIPETFNYLKDEFPKIIDRSKCLANPSSVSCIDLCQGKRTACAGSFLESASGVMEKAQNVLLGKVEGNKYTPGVATAIISTIALTSSKLFDLSVIKDKFKDNKIVNKVKDLVGKMNTVIVPKFAVITGYLQTALDLIKALSISLNPTQAMKNAPDIELPPIELKELNETSQDDSFIIEE